MTGRALRAALVVGSLLIAGAGSFALAEDAKPDAPAATPATPPLLKTVQSTPKGQLKNPYSPSNEAIVADGKKLFFSYSCNGCHGGTGGGGMCPQLNGDVWFWGIDDDALFRLVATGSVGMQNAGFTHLGGTMGLQMPPFGELIKSDDELWKILTWVRSIYKGDPKKKTW